MSDPHAGKYHRLYGADFDLANEVLAKHGGDLAWGVHDYQAFVYREPTVCLVFYPHRTSAGHHHIRVRDQGSKDSKRAAQLLRELNAATIGCTFSEKHMYSRRRARGEPIHD